MTGDPKKVEDLFDQALELPAEERAAFLEKACGTEVELRQRIEALISASEAQSGFLAVDGTAGLSETLVDESVPTEQSGTRIGRYKLLEKLGEGGFGAVWAAEQRKPVKRRVALKIVKLGMDTKQVIARFEAERQALALMDHPNIAKVLDAGTTETGRPYFVMELVKGIPITHYFDQEGTTVQEKLRLFIRICHAIQHAHQKGIIHRDIKPSNVMVTLHDGEPVPKVIDFGIAKATQGDLTDKTIYTHYNQFIGTPAYMSPEQAEMSGLDVDTRSDIYSLGVLLYEILTGFTPFDAKELMASGIDEMRKIIRERDPVKPSTRLIELSRSGTSAKKPYLVLNSVEADLDWIVMKCLEKDRARRYETANGLAADLNRHLKNEPVVARPPSKLYQIQKAWKRNRLLYGALSGTLVALALGLLVSTWQMKQAKDARVLADQARKSETEAKNHAEALREQAEINARIARRKQYASDMFLASEAVSSRNFGRAIQLLNRHRPNVSATTDEDLRGWEWRYLWKQCRSDELRPLGTEPGWARSVSISSDGRRVAVAVVQVNADRALPHIAVIHDLHTLTRTEIELTSRPMEVDFLPGGSMLALGLEEGKVVFIDAATGEYAQQQLSLDSAPREMYVSGDGNWLFVRTISRWELYRLNENSSTKLLESDFSRNTSEAPVCTTAFSPDSRWLLTWYMEKGRLAFGMVDLQADVPTFTPHDTFKPSGGLVFSPAGDHIAVFGSGSKLLFYRWQNGQVSDMREAKSESLSYSYASFSQDGKHLFVTGVDQQIEVWDVASLKPLRILKGHRDEVWTMDLSEDGQFLVTGSKDGDVKIWQANGTELLSQSSEKRLWHANAFSSPGGHLLAFWKRGEGLSTRIVSAQNLRVEREVDDVTMIQFALSDDAQVYAVGASGEIRVVNEHADSPDIMKLSMLGERAQYMSFGYGNRFLASGSDGNRVRVWEVETGELMLTIENIPTQPGVMRGGLPFSLAADQPLIAVFGEVAGTLEIWNIQTGQRLENGVYDLGGDLRASAFIPRTTRVVAAPINGYLTLIDYADGKVIERQKSQKQGLHSVAVSPDQSRIAAGSTQEGVRLWTADIQDELMVLPVDHAVRELCFSADGNTLFAIGMRQTKRFTAPTWEEIEKSERQNRITE